MSASISDPPEHRHVAVDRRLVMINGASSVLVRLVNVFGLLWAYQYLLARIPAEEFALYPVLTAVMVFAPLMFSFFSGGIARYVVADYASGDFAGVGRIVSSVFPLLGVITLVFLAASAVFARFIDDILTIPPGMVDEARLMFALLAGSFALQMLLMPLGVGFHVRQRFVELNLIGLLRDVLRITLLFVLLLGFGPSVVWVVVAMTAADLVHLAVVTWRSCRMVPEIRVRPALFSWQTAVTLVNFGLWTSLGQLAAILYTNMGTLILNAQATATAVTSYYLGATCFQQIQSMIGLARQPLQPALVAMHTLADEQRLARAALRGGRYGLWVALFVACPLAIYAVPLVDLLLGDTYAEAALVLVLFMAIFPFNQPAGLLPMIAVAKAEVRRFNVAALVSTLAGLGLMMLATAGFGLGALGVAAALALVTIVAQLVYFWPLNLQLTGLSFRDLRREVLVPGLAPSACASAVWLAIAVAAPPAGWLGLGLAVAAGGGVYVAVLLAACLDAVDRASLVRLCGRLLVRRTRSQ